LKAGKNFVQPTSNLIDIKPKCIILGETRNWNKDPMVVINALEKTYVLKTVGIPEYYLGGNVEFLGEA
jgi:hypothetical protein